VDIIKIQKEEDRRDRWLTVTTVVMSNITNSGLDVTADSASDWRI